MALDHRPCVTHGNRLAFGCPSCVRRKQNAVAQAEIDSYPQRVVSFHWHAPITGTLTARLPVKPGWTDDDIMQHHWDWFNEHIGPEVSTAIANIDQFDALMKADVRDIAVADLPPEPPRDDQPTLFGEAS